MNEDQFRSYLTREGAAASTISTKIASIKRIERDEGVDLDEEFEKDQIAKVIERFQYSMDDFRAGKPNPTKSGLKQPIPTAT